MPLLLLPLLCALAAPGGATALEAGRTAAAADLPSPGAFLQVGDTLDQAADTLDALQDVVGDTVPEEEVIRSLPRFPGPRATGWTAGTWEWNRDDIQGGRALTLLELVEQVPGVLALRGGDHGNPATVMAAGIGAGRVRVFADGAELAPLDGGVADLARIGLVGIERVRVVRRPGEIRIHLVRLQPDDPRPYSLLEVGTGDLETNLFRGTFAHPDALGGSVLIALDRVDTAGPFRDAPGAAFGALVRHQIVPNERWGLAWEFRRMTSRRPTMFYQPEDVTRTDWDLRGSVELIEGVVAEGFYHRSTLGLDEDVGEEAAALVTADARSQAGVRVGAERGPVWARADLRLQGGPGWPGSVQGLTGGTTIGPWMEIEGGVERQGWEDRSGTVLHGRVRSGSLAGFSAYAGAETGSRAVPRFVPPPDPPDEDEPPENGEEPGNGTERIPPPRFSEVTGLRAGAEFRRGDLRLAAGVIRVDPDSLLPTGLPFDRDGVATAVGSRTGVEFTGSLPLSPLLEGLRLEGAGQVWGGGEGWTYGPAGNWQGRLHFHDIFMESGNLEVWGDIGVQGRAPMLVPLSAETGLQRVPMNQSWYLRVQVRIVSVRIFVRWDNFTLRDENMDLPDRHLPQTRAMYGIRWMLWN